ncbi:MAG: UDP-N-acetylmuramoyl-L-alanyl-D-glutamate--2,6-diaminopimelate ligase [Patescibacteria group bacterium]
MLNYLRKKISYDNPIRLLWHRLKGIAAATRYGFPAKRMVIIGVTGTNGKTTTSHMIEHILRGAGKKAAMISTSDFSINGKRKPNLSKKTTMSPFKTQKFLKDCVKKKVDYAVIEASSHALHQSRLWGIPFSISVITNITHEHLDYHGTMEKYAEAKKILFRNVSKNCSRKETDAVKHIPHIKAFVLNTADKYYDKFKEIHCPVNIDYGLDRGDLRARDITYTKFGSKFAMKYHGETVGIDLPLAGGFNVENALAAAGAALACKVPLEKIGAALSTFKGVGGRMERIKSPKGFEVIVDFALTPDALEKLYKVLRETTEGRLIGLIGSCGDRDKEKRPVMGEIVASYCDITIVTDEEPYTEDPKVIMQAVLAGAKKVKKMGEKLKLIEDRYKAMEDAVKNAKPGDVIVVTGMGSFQTRSMNDGPISWDEREVAREIISKNA